MTTLETGLKIRDLRDQINKLTKQWELEATKELADRGIVENTPIEWGEYGKGFFSRVVFDGLFISLYYHIATTKGLPSKSERITLIRDTNEIVKM